MSNLSYISIDPNSSTASQECEVNLIHEDRVKEALAEVVDNRTAAGLAEAFQALSDPTRVKLISALMATELCVCDLSAVLGMTQSAVSHQLRILRALRLVKNRKEGRIVYYSLDDEHIRDLFSRGLEHYKHRTER